MTIEEMLAQAEQNVVDAMTIAKADQGQGIDTDRNRNLDADFKGLDQAKKDSDQAEEDDQDDDQDDDNDQDDSDQDEQEGQGQPSPFSKADQEDLVIDATEILIAIDQKLARLEALEKRVNRMAKAVEGMGNVERLAKAFETLGVATATMAKAQSVMAGRPVMPKSVAAQTVKVPTGTVTTTGDIDPNRMFAKAEQAVINRQMSAGDVSLLTTLTNQFGPEYALQQFSPEIQSLLGGK